MSFNLEYDLIGPDILDAGEVALYSKDGEIFSLFPSIKNLLETWGWRFYFVSWTKSEGQIRHLIETYVDNSGNSLLVNFELSEIALPMHNLSLADCYKILDVVAFDRDGAENVDLNEYLKFYPQNNFESVVERIRKRLAKKEVGIKIFYA